MCRTYDEDVVVLCSAVLSYLSVLLSKMVQTRTLSTLRAPRLNSIPPFAFHLLFSLHYLIVFTLSILLSCCISDFLQEQSLEGSSLPLHRC